MLELRAKITPSMLKLLTKCFDPGQGPVLVAAQQFDKVCARVGCPMSALAARAQDGRGEAVNSDVLTSVGNSLLRITLTIGPRYPQAGIDYRMGNRTTAQRLRPPR